MGLLPGVAPSAPQASQTVSASSSMIWCPPILVDTSCLRALNSKRCGEIRAYGRRRAAPELCDTSSLPNSPQINGKIESRRASASNAEFFNNID
jgi:hypothetical protein